MHISGCPSTPLGTESALCSQPIDSTALGPCHGPGPIPAAGSVSDRSAGNPWIVLRTRTNHELCAAILLASRGYSQYLPLISREADPRRAPKHPYCIRVPLLTGYVFCKFDYSNHRERLDVLSTIGLHSTAPVLRFGSYTPLLTDEDILRIKTMVISGAQPLSSPPPLTPGCLVRIRFSGFDYEGKLLSIHGESKIILEVPGRFAHVEIRDFKMSQVKRIAA